MANAEYTWRTSVMVILTVILMSRLLALVVPQHTDPWWVEPVITSTVLALAVAAVLVWHRRRQER
jgi:uncharacterized membrane protein